MASLKKFPDIPKGYTLPQLKELDRALETLFPDRLGLSYAPQKSFKGQFFAWKEPVSAEKFVLDLTNQDNIKYAELVINNWQETLTAIPEYQAPTYSGAPEPEAKANIPGEATREEQERLRAEREAKLKETQIESKQAVEAAIKKQQEIYLQQKAVAEKLKAELEKNGSKVYIKIEKPEPGENAQIDSLKEQSEINPQNFVNDTSKHSQAKISTEKLSVDEIGVASKQIGLTINETATGNSPLIQIAVINKIASDPALLKKLIPNAADQQQFKDIVSILTDQKTSQYELAKAFYDLSKVDGVSNINDIKIEISPVSQPGFKEFDLNQQIVTPHIESLDQSINLAGTIKDFSVDEIKSQLLLAVGKDLSSQVAKLPAESLAARAYNSELVQLGLSSIGLVKAAPWVATEGSLFGRIAVGSGYGPLAGFIQTKTGINLGVKLATKTTVETGVKAGASTVAKTGAKALVSKATAALGSTVAPVVGTIVGWLGGELLVKIAEKIPWKKIKEYGVAILALPVILGGLVFKVPLITIGGLGLGAVGLGAASGLTLNRFFRRAGDVLAAVGTAILIRVATPVIVALLVLPVVVALILFIINSGAYIVPQGPLSFNAGQTIISPYIDVQKVANPPGPFQNSNLPLTVQYQITIKAKKGPLTNINFLPTCNVTKKSGSGVCPPETAVKAGPEGSLKDVGSFPPPIPTTITPDTAYIITYSQTYDPANFQDSFVTDTFTVKADSTEKRGAEAAASAGIKIGNPPDTCPSGWPVAGRRMITQTPGGSFSHQGIEAMDIGTLPIGTPVHSTTSGTATVVYTSGPYRPVYVDISSICAGKQIRVRYAHFSGVAVKTGQQVVMGQLLGASGTEGSGPHLHYEFIGIRMDVPYIPKSIPRGCSNDTGLCGYIP